MGGLTATDMVALAGVDLYGTTPADVFADKMGWPRKRREPNVIAATLGNLTEPYNITLLSEKYGLRIVPGTTVRHASIPWILATPDAVAIEQEGAPLATCEVKDVGPYMKRHWGEEDEPLPYPLYVQLHWQMVALDVREGYVGCFLGHEHRSWRVERDESLAKALVGLGERFWHRHVLPKKPPALDGSAGGERILVGLYPRPLSTTLAAAPGEAERWASQYAEASRTLAAAEERKAEAQQRLCAMIGDKEGILSPSFKATWKWRAESTRKASVSKAHRQFYFRHLASDDQGEPTE